MTRRGAPSPNSALARARASNSAKGLRAGSFTDASKSPSPLSVAALRRHLIHEYPHWAAHLDGRLLSAVNQEMANGQTPVRDGDEVAFFPPVTGG